MGTLEVGYTALVGDLSIPIPDRDLREAELSADSLHAIALHNLAADVVEQGLRLKAHGSIMAVTFDGDLESALLLYPPLWARLHDELGDELIVAVPARDVLAVCPADSAPGIDELRGVIERVWPRDDHPLTTDLLRRDADTWSVFARLTHAE